MAEDGARNLGDDDKARAILGAAFEVFAQYGFRRTSMEDIARAAGVSRPALYQHFRNKEDIARSMVQVYYADTVVGLEAALVSGGDPGAVLEAAFLAVLGQVKEKLAAAPHASEFLEATGSVAPDVIAEGNAQRVRMLADWLSGEADAGRITGVEDATVLAQTLFGALEGAKAPPLEGYRARVVTLARLLGRGLERT